MDLLGCNRLRFFTCAESVRIARDQLLGCAEMRVMMAFAMRTRSSTTLVEMIEELNEEWERTPAVVGVPYNGRPWSATASHNFNAPQPFTFRDGVRATYSFLLCSVVLVRCRFGLPRDGTRG